ncbi:MAG: hypothetical protein HOI96_04505 [Rhodospirillaceae bacterium]|nr:hypothetical protein [Rhodospirillaceae bacterium]
MSNGTGLVTDMTMHQAIRAQVLEVLEKSDMTEEQKQQILVSLSCPCCGGGGVSLTIPLDNSKPVF